MDSSFRLAAYEPDRPHNLGALMRLCACFGLGLDVIEPCGFPLDDRRIREAGLDYHRHVRPERHLGFASFRERLAGRLVLLTTRGELPYHRAAYQAGDTLLLGRESAGVPEPVHAAAHLRVRIPLRPGLRSLNVAVAAAIVAAEALRQVGGFPEVQQGVVEVDG